MSSKPQGNNVKWMSFFFWFIIQLYRVSIALLSEAVIGIIFCQLGLEYQNDELTVYFCLQSFH